MTDFICISPIGFIGSCCREDEVVLRAGVGGKGAGELVAKCNRKVPNNASDSDNRSNDRRGNRGSRGGGGSDRWCGL
jgi:hypothetical protein